MGNLNNLSFGSQFRYERVFLKGNASFSLTDIFGPDPSQTVTIPHDLGYEPYFRLSYTYGDGKYFQAFAGTGSFDLDGNGTQIDNINATDTDLLVTLFNFGASPVTGTLYYRIYAEPQQ